MLTEKISEKVRSITDKSKCAEELRAWLSFFREGHLSLQLMDDSESSEQEQLSEEDIRAKFLDWPTYPFDRKEFEKYVSGLDEAGFEGIWNDPPYTFGIKKVDDQYVGFIIEADGVYWTESQVKFRIQKDKGSFSVNYYMRNHSERQFENAELIGNNHLQMGFVSMKRVAPVMPDSEADIAFEKISKIQSSWVPVFEKLSDNTCILRIPSFLYSEKSAIDSLLMLHRREILSTENFIIDIRDNGGGSDASFEGLLPLMYTNPIRTLGVEYLSTPLNNQRMVDFMNDPDWSEEDKKWAEDSYKVLNEHIGEFINLDTSMVTIDKFDTIYANPRNIGIIINQGNGSTAEQFLLSVKQSKKVKLFGTTTVGVLDISNMYFIKSPCEEYQLGYSLTRSLRIPGMAIDGKGIQPDYFLDKSIPDHQWINFVMETLEE